MLVGATIRFFALDLVASILYFPVWWYTQGALHVAKIIVHEARSVVHSLNLPILFRFLLTPMFGQYDFWGRVISFGVRLVHFGVLFVYSVALIMLLFVVLLVWLVLPIFILYNILFHLGITSPHFI